MTVTPARVKVDRDEVFLVEPPTRWGYREQVREVSRTAGDGAARHDPVDATNVGSGLRR